MRYEVCGVAIDSITLDEAADAIEKMYFSDRPCSVFYCNPETLVRARRDARFRALVRKGDVVFPDGIGLLLWGRFVGARIKERIAGIDVMIRVCEASARLGKSVFFLGGEKGVAEKAAEVLRAMFPQLRIAGACDGFEGLALCETRKDLYCADAVFVGLGTPMQEEWIAAHAHKLPRLKIAMAVGGGMDMLSGLTPRAPLFLRKIGLEWLWRCAREPKKRWRRMLNATVVFPMMILYDACVMKFKSQNAKRKVQKT